MKNNTLVQTVYKCVWTLVALFATILTLTDYIGKSQSTMLYFTTWSVWLCLVAAIACTVPAVTALIRHEEIHLTKYHYLLKFCADIMIIATFIVAGFVLPNKLWMAGYWTLGGAFKHFFVPVLTVLDTVLFDDKKVYKVWYPFAAVVIPLLYWIIVIVRICIFRSSQGGAIPENLWDQYYPYGFTNFDNGHSLGGLIGLLAGILVGLIAIGFAFWAVDNFLGTKDKNGK